MIEVFNQCPNVTKLTLDNFGPFKDDQFPKLNSKILKNLTELKVDWERGNLAKTFSTISKQCHKLTSLSISGQELKSKQILSSFLSCGLLTHLYLNSYFVSLSDLYVALEKSQIRQLQTLIMPGHQNNLNDVVPAAKIIQLFYHSFTDINLSVEKFIQITACEISPLTKIREFTLNIFPRPQMREDYTPLFDVLPSITAINMKFRHPYCFDTLPETSTLICERYSQTLKIMSFIDCVYLPGVTNEIVNKIVTSCEVLEYLKLENTNKITNECIEMLCATNRSHNLYKFDLISCDEITTDGVINMLSDTHNTISDLTIIHCGLIHSEQVQAVVDRINSTTKHDHTKHIKLTTHANGQGRDDTAANKMRKEIEMVV
jgi:hypothetical protein